MTGKIRFGLATEEDDVQLRKIMRENYMEGKISIAFETEPSFFKATNVQGKKIDVIVGKDKFGKIQSFGIRAIKPMYVNKEIINIGYLSGLRVNSDLRNNIWLSKGYRFFKELDADRKVSFYLTTIISDNKKAIATLESGKASLPKYQKIGQFATFLIPKQRVKTTKDFEIHRGDNFTIEELLCFINQHGKEKQFFPRYEKEDFGTDFLNGLNLEDFYVATKDGKIKGLIALWDQNEIKQTRVINYSQGIKLLRPINNLFSPLTHSPNLLKIGETFNNTYAAMPISIDNDPLVLEFILSHVLRELPSDNLLFGVSTEDDFFKSVSKFGKRKYMSNIYVVSFDGVDTSQLNGQIPYLETGAL